MTANDQTDAFLRAIIANPDDDAPRLIFADWLEEHGEGERSEFIRVQCEIAKGPPGLRCSEITYDSGGTIRAKLESWKPLRKGERIDICCYSSLPTDRPHWVTAAGIVDSIDHFLWSFTLREASKLKPWPLYEREQELLNADFANPGYIIWGPPSECHATEWKFSRGFVSEITLACQDWLTHREQLLRAVTLEKVTLTNWGYGFFGDRPSYTPAPPFANHFYISPGVMGACPPVTLRVCDGKLFKGAEEVVVVSLEEHGILFGAPNREQLAADVPAVIVPRPSR